MGLFFHPRSVVDRVAFENIQSDDSYRFTLSRHAVSTTRVESTTDKMIAPSTNRSCREDRQTTITRELTFMRALSPDYETLSQLRLVLYRISQGNMVMAMRDRRTGKQPESAEAVRSIASRPGTTVRENARHLADLPRGRRVADGQIGTRVTGASSCRPQRRCVTRR